jgi:FKBP-type peptidyl-prolyl cis-trans isomerase
MRLSRSLPFALLVCAVVSAGRAQGIQFKVPGQADNAAPASPPRPDQPVAAPAPPPTYTEEQIAEEAGWIISKRIGLANFELTPEEIGAFGQGFALEASRHDSPYDVRLIGPQMNAFMVAKRSAHVARVKQENEATAAVFFAKLKADPTVKQTPSGLCYQVIKPGTAPFPGPKDVVLVNYVGKLLDGTVFDSTMRPRQSGAPIVPAQLRLDDMIPGCAEGVQLIGKGGEIRLYIPARLAYGDEDRVVIPAASTLVFDVQLLDMKPGPAPGAGGQR